MLRLCDYEFNNAHYKMPLCFDNSLFRHCEVSEVRAENVRDKLRKRTFKLAERRSFVMKLIKHAVAT